MIGEQTGWHVYRTCLRLQAMLCIFSIIAFLSGCKREITGGYLAHSDDKNSVAWLDIVRTPDDRLTAQFALISLQPDGSIQRQSLSLAGVVNGDNFMLTSEHLFNSVSISGTRHWNTLTLTGNNGVVPAKFVKSSMSEYQSLLSGIESRSQAIIKARTDAHVKQMEETTEQNLLAEIDSVIRQMQQFDSEVDVHLGGFPRAEERFRSITANVEQYVAREQRLSEAPQTSVQRSQLSVGAMQASLLTDQIHNQVESLSSSARDNIQNIESALLPLENPCGPTPHHLVLTREQAQRLEVPCGRLHDVEATFHQKSKAIEDGLSSLEEIYQAEHTKQQELLHEADQYAN